MNICDQCALLVPDWNNAFALLRAVAPSHAPIETSRHLYSTPWCKGDHDTRGGLATLPAYQREHRNLCIDSAKNQKPVFYDPSTLVLDIETLRPAWVAEEKQEPDIQYAGTWEQEAAIGYMGMGMAVVVVVDLVGNQWYFPRDANGFMDNGIQLQGLLALAHNIVTFNGDNFDFPLLVSSGYQVIFSKSIDLRTRIRNYLGLKKDDHSKLSLKILAELNGLAPKSPDAGGMAPVLWQRGEYGRAIKGCLQDALLTRSLFSLATGEGIKLPEGKIYKFNQGDF